MRGLTLPARAHAFLALASLLLSFVPVCFGEDGTQRYYVAPSGSDHSSGTIRNPFATIQRAVDAAAPGDTIIVRNGIYGRAACRSDSDFAVDIVKSGTESAIIRIAAENKWQAILDGEKVCHSYFNLGAGAAYIAIEGFVITRGAWAAVWSNSRAHHIVLRGNRIQNVGNWRDTGSQYGLAGLYTGKLSHHFTIEGNVFHDVGRRSGTVNHDHALYLRGSDFLIINNVFYNNTRGWAIQSADPFRNALIANNTFAFPNPARDGHILLWGSGQSNIIIRNNLFWHPKGSAIAYCDAEFTGANNFDHNVVYGAGAVVGGDQCSGSSGLETIKSSKNAIADPLFVEPRATDFRLQPGSPAIGSGVALLEVTRDFAGTPRAGAPSIGAFEFIRVPKRQRSAVPSQRPPS